jgi:L-iditol 2-dehydrogenase
MKAELVEKPVPEPGAAEVLVRNTIYVFGIRGEGRSVTHRVAALMAQKRFDAKR